MSALVERAHERTCDRRLIQYRRCADMRRSDALAA